MTDDDYDDLRAEWIKAIDGRGPPILVGNKEPIRHYFGIAFWLAIFFAIGFAAGMAA